MTDKPWSERIPAMIAKAGRSGLPDGTKWAKWYGKDGGDKHESAIVTREEVALATALWALLVHESQGGRDYMVNEPPAPLIAFTEKMERIAS